MGDVIMADAPALDLRPPKEKVFGTGELLDEILLYLPIGQMLQIQRVSRQFRDMIASSEVLQRAMFFRCSDKDVESQEMPVLNPVFVRYDDQRPRLIFKPQRRQNKFFCILRPYTRDHASNPAPEQDEDGDWHLYLDIRESTNEKRTARALRQGCWGKMHFSRPPVELHVCLRRSVQNTDYQGYQPFSGSSEEYYISGGTVMEFFEKLEEEKVEKKQKDQREAREKQMQWEERETKKKKREERAR